MPSQLVDGAQDHHRFGDPDEQGARADRGLSPVPGRAGPARGGGAPAVDRPLPWSPIATARCWRSWPAPTCARRSRSAWPGRRAWRRRPSASIWSSSATADLRGARRERFPALGLARAGAAAGRHGAGRAQRRQRGGRRGLPGSGRIGFLRHRRNLWPSTLEMADGAACSCEAADLDDVLAIDAAARAVGAELAGEAGLAAEPHV